MVSVLASSKPGSVATRSSMIPQLSSTSIRQAMLWAGDERRLAQACQAVLTKQL